MNLSDLRILAEKVGVHIKKLSAQTMNTLNNAPRAQKRTATYKKAVFIVEDLVFKGPYTTDDDHPRLMKNLRFTYAIQQLEEALHLPGWKRGALPWKFIGLWSVDQYYLVAPNVGKWKDITFERVSSKLETNVPIVPRGGFVSRVSDVEKNGGLSNGIKSAALQHLYLRFLLDIGDSGTHNILIREGNDTTGRLIAGVDLEEEITDNVKVRRSKVKKQCLDLLFSSVPSKSQVQLYESDIHKIKSLSYPQINQHTIDKLQTVGIDLDSLKVNMARW